MKYVTAIDLSVEWGISNRMITIHCKKGSIRGAIKRGNLWLIPANAQKPIDKRKISSNTLEIDGNIAEEGTWSILNKAEIDCFDTVYSPRDMKLLGLTRDTLRYYEKIGVIEPRRKIENAYRKFDTDDVHNLMTIDFHKKRGFNLLEIKNLIQQSNHLDTLDAFGKKIVEIEQTIYEQQCMLNKLKEAKELAEYALDRDGKFEIRNFPLFSVLKSFDNQWDFSNYDDKTIRALDGEDILSHAVRAVSFNSTSFTGSTICIVKKVTEEDSCEQFLESGRCMYIAVALIAEQDHVSFAERIFTTGLKWAKEHDVELKGMAYAFMSFFVLGVTHEQFFEFWFPIK